ncbi:hypothetical protein INT43_006344 [Umbelopsis isabellina]|uniref:Glycosyltransferase family 49 protein n=1 Tax=Mortierella isabellina TaxID=91625 RepID=A0A8H7ULM5_MORIS|nr:hypothetical protein INT43_006344 [Umbelopsis isabellina]
MRAEISQSISKAVKYIFVIYVAASLIYTAHHLYATYSAGNADISLHRPSLQRDSSPVVEHPIEAKKETRLDKQIVWVNEQGVDQNMPENFMLSKVFSDAMGPSKVIPYYFKAQAAFDVEDITIATLVTQDRFPVLSRLVTHYQGPISVAIHIQDDESHEEILADLHELYRANPLMKEYVDLHLIVDKFDRQFNMWRNVAKFFARSDYIVMLDVDFHICTDFRKSIRQNPAVMDKLRSGTTALVIPAFEFVEQPDGLDWKTFPTNKPDLLQLVGDEKIDMFHRAWKKGHGSTNYTKWYESDAVYEVTDYNFSYEPYVIYKKEGSPWCDERFIGYGANKAACLYEIYLSGIQYEVLPHDFLIHQTHYYPESERAKERAYNRKLYDNFREEVCLRYARMFIEAGDWESPRAENLRLECHKIRAFRTAIKSLS